MQRQVSSSEKNPTGYYLYRCLKCGQRWRSMKGREEELLFYDKLERDDVVACKKCGKPADEVVTQIEYCEAPNWRERWPKLPKGVTARNYTRSGEYCRFVATYKQKYLGIFTLISDAENAVREAMAWESATSKKEP